jgi:hypothetical protein
VVIHEKAFIYRAFWCFIGIPVSKSAENTNSVCESQAAFVDKFKKARNVQHYAWCKKIMRACVKKLLTAFF